MKEYFKKNCQTWEGSMEPDFSRYPITSVEFTSVLKRMLKVSSCESENDLERYLELSYGEINEAKARNMIPAYYLIVLMKKSHASPKWILTGHGDQYITAISESISEEIDIIMQLANENKMIRKRILYLYGKESRFLY